MIFRRRRRDPRAELISDVVRAAGYIQAIQIMAQRLDAPDIIDAAAALAIWRVWLAKLRTWAEDR